MIGDSIYRSSREPRLYVSPPRRDEDKSREIEKGYMHTFAYEGSPVRREKGTEEIGEIARDAMESQSTCYDKRREEKKERIKRKISIVYCTPQEKVQEEKRKINVKLYCFRQERWKFVRKR